MKLWVDGVSGTVQNNTSTFDTFVSLATGSHRIVVQAADASTGTVYSSPSATITVKTGNTITVSPSSATVTEGTTQQFTATDSGGLSVTWSASCGTITSGGMFTAPNAVETCTITAKDSTGAAGTATANIQAPSGSSQVTIQSPVNGSTVTSPVAVHATYNGTASYMKLWIDHVASTVQQNTSTFSTSVSLSAGAHLLEVQAADATTGTVFTTPTNITVTSGTTVTITPSSATVPVNGTQQFSANVSVTWSVTGDGTISSGGLFTAGSTTGSAVVTATATNGSGAHASANVTVGSSSSPVVWVTPTAGATVTSPFEAKFTFSGGTASYMKLWIDNVAYSVIQYNTSTYDTTLSLAAGTHKLSGQAHNGTTGVTYTTSETITVSTGGTGVTISPASATTVVGGTQQFTANVSVTWSTSCGTISSSGLFTAPASPTTCTITATSGTGTKGTATDTVVNANTTLNYTTWKNSNDTTGRQMNEIILTPSNVNSSTFGVKFMDSVDGYVYGQPLYMSNISINGTTHNVVYVVTENDSVYAFDADAVGSPLWKKSLLMGGTTIPQANVGSTIYPVIGITSTPVIDPSTNTIYVLAETLEQSTNYIFRLHALDLSTGNEKFGGPVQLTDPNFAPKEQLQRGALMMANGYIYIPFGSHGDHQPYKGWIFAYSASTLSKAVAWNDEGTGTSGGIWGGGGPLSIDANGDVFATSGNGNFDGSVNFGESFIKLSPNLSVLDYFTPYNHTALSTNDIDLGTGGLLLVPTLSGTFPQIAIGTGKMPSIYVVNRDNMGHVGSTSDSQIIQRLDNAIGISGTTTDRAFLTPAYFNGSVYFVANGDVIKAFSLNASTGQLSSTPSSKGSFVFPFPGGQPVVSSNGTSGNAIVWVMDHASGAALHAYNAANVAQQLYVSPSLGTGAKWAVPTVINGKVYVGTSGQLVCFGLLQ